MKQSKSYLEKSTCSFELMQTPKFMAQSQLQNSRALKLKKLLN